MNTLLIASLAGVLAVAPGSSNEPSDSATAHTSQIDLSFASPTAIAASSKGMKAPRARMGGHGMKMRGMRGGYRMKRMGGSRGAGKYVRTGRRGYGKGYRRPYRGFRLPQAFIQPSYFIGNFGFYGLSRPSAGYGWSRYYDDAVLTDRRGVVYDTRRNINWDRYNQGYNDGYRAGKASYDQSVFYSDARVVAPTGSVQNGATYQGDWNGAYRPDGSYQGDWQGTYQGTDGQTYQGQYSGTFTGQANVAPAGANYADAPHWNSGNSGYAQQSGSYQGNDLAYLEQCKKSSGFGGALVGGAVGALAGNRIAGRGDRLGGSLIGGGVGALAGAAIDQNSSKCRELMANGYQQPGYQSGGRGDELAYLEQCKKSSGLGGALAGGAIGALAGNRIAGRGDRLGGSLIGGGVGALAGAAIDRSSDRCRKLLKKYGEREVYSRAQTRQRYQPAPAPAPRAYNRYPSGWQGQYYPAYYYQQQAPQVTTVVVQSQPVTTTTTTTVEEEYVYEQPKYAGKKLYKPAAKRVWKPRVKAAPVLKGCQQANCYYDQ